MLGIEANFQQCVFYVQFLALTNQFAEHVEYLEQFEYSKKLHDLKLESDKVCDQIHNITHLKSSILERKEIEWQMDYSTISNTKENSQYIEPIFDYIEKMQRQVLLNFLKKFFLIKVGGLDEVA